VTDRSLRLVAQANLATIASTLQPTRALAGRLASLAQEADSRGLKWLSVECLIRRAEVLGALGDQESAVREGDRALARAEELGLKVPLAKAHYLKASVLRAKGDQAARREFALALRLLEQIRNDSGNEKVLERADLAPVYADSLKASQRP
jgi:tetratricopeptide (TPR) repeat protein